MITKAQIVAKMAQSPESNQQKLQHNKMGERHLVYLRVNNERYGKHEEEEIYFNKNVIGLHVQWLLGYSALNCLVNLLDFHRKNIFHSDGKNINLSPFSQMASDSMYRMDAGRKYTNAEKVLQALYSVCSVTGFWETSAKILNKHDFFSNDNNTGITIIDLLEFDQPKYCFLNPGNWFVDTAIKTLPSCEPLDAVTYLTGFGQPPQDWNSEHLPVLFEKIAKVKLLTKQQLYTIFLPPSLLAAPDVEETVALLERQNSHDKTF
jgi:hypothetical protein